MTFRLGACVFGGLGALAAQCVAPASAQTTSRYDIPAQDMERALVAFALQSGIALSLPASGLGTRQSSGLRGAYTVEAGLSRLLAGSGLAYEQVAPRAYKVVPGPVPAPPPPSAPPEVKPDVVIISARAPLLEGSVPRDIVRLDGTSLAQRGMTSDQRLQDDLNGLAFTNLGPGRDKIILRGLSDGALSGRAQSLAGLYFGDVRLTYRAPDPDLQLIDVNAVEILSGPQGALYGAGSIGGIVHIEPTRVDLHEFSAAAETSASSTLGGAAGGDWSLMANAPLFDGAVGVRGVIYDQRIGGWLDNPRTGETNANASHRSGKRLQVRFQFDDNWSLELSGASQDTADRDAQYLANTATGAVRRSAFLEPHDNDFGLGAVIIRGAWPWADVNSTTSIVQHQLSSRYEATGAFPDLQPIGSAAQALDEIDKLTLFQNETRLTSKPGATIPWFVGVFYADGDTRRNMEIREGLQQSLDTLDYAERRIDNIDELALFGEATWPLAPMLSLSTGIRIFRSTLDVQSNTQWRGSGAAAESLKLSESGIAPDIRLRYQPNSGFLVYLSAARGYRAGGFNTGGLTNLDAQRSTQPWRRYAGDEVWTFELGARGRLLNDRLHLSAIAFQSDWRDVQTDTLINRGFTFSGNVGDARVAGLEASGRYSVTDNLLLNLHFLVNEPEVRRPSSTFPGVQAAGLPGASEYSGGASARYEWQALLAGSSATLFVESGASYVGPSLLGFTPGEKAGGYTSVSARFGIERGHWQALAYIDNLTNADGPTFAVGNPYRPGEELITPLRPQTLGVSLQRTF